MSLTLLLSYFLTLYYGPSPNIRFSTTSVIPMTDFIHPEFKFQYPDSWNVDTSTQWGAAAMVFSPLENEEDNFSENINVLVQDLAGQKIDLEAYKTITEEQIKTFASDWNILESAVAKDSRGECYKLAYTMAQGIFKLRITSICFIENDKAYLLTFTTKLDTFEKYRKDGEAILASFAVTKS